MRSVQAPSRKAVAVDAHRPAAGRARRALLARGIAAAALTVLAACGKRGDLKLPDEPKPGQPG